jgi:membrane protein DedA with SNARE-associated domain
VAQAFAVRFAFGARIVLPIACGAARLRIPIFLIGSAIASLVWSAVFVTLGWLFGETALLVLGHIRRYEDELTGLLIAAVVVVAVVLYQRTSAAAADRSDRDDRQRPAITDEGRA